jgi:uncharacterized repeat protein (TIGR01451 family)
MRMVVAATLAMLAPALANAGPPDCTCAAPLLFVRISAPPGVKVTLYPGRAAPRSFPTPVVVGLRPGYIYRYKLSNFPDQPKLALYPSIEVRNSLRLPPIIRAADHPAPIPVTADDVRLVRQGAMLTKVTLLEDPEQAIAVQSDNDRPIELETPSGGDPIEEARAHGRPLIVMRLGERELTEEELVCQAVPGTILFPGERVLSPAWAPPPLSFACLPILDPLWGAKCLEGECLHDGGDTETPVGLDRNGQLFGLDPSDTVATYADDRGSRRLTVSNRVCICVPRFLVMRAELLPTGYQAIVQVGAEQAVQAQVRLEGRLPIKDAMQAEGIDGLRGREKPSANLLVTGPAAINRLEVLNAYHLNIGTAEALSTQGMRFLTGEQRTEIVKQMEFALVLAQPLKVSEVDNSTATSVVGRVEGVNVVGSMIGPQDITICCGEVPQIPGRPLHLYKWVSTKTAQVGDVVTFFLKYSNVGGQPMTDVALNDSLTGRLEYVPGTAKSSRDAVFTTSENKAGSVILHWEISGTLPAGQSGTVSFQARIR